MNNERAHTCQEGSGDSQKGAGLPVIYFTELLAEALGVKEEAIAMMNQKETKWKKAVQNQPEAAGGEKDA